MKRGPALLSELTALAEERALAVFGAGLAAEMALRAEADALEARRRDAVLGEGADPARRTVGADAAWLNWLGSRRTQVNRDLARAAAERHERLSETQTAFARARLAEELFARAKAAERHARQAREEIGLHELGLLAGLRDWD